MSSIVRALGALRNNFQQIRITRPHIEAQYRQFPQLTKRQLFQSELISGTMWFWILWNFWKSPEEVLGHFPYPDISKWTDEELGIPPDDEE
ncbi:NADH dehydrogenase [ubiquinone] 1 beta subcomplex subunit 2, mitochondrial [Cynoglossus semilaevis]|uniref:NADH dehydrogenase [ubiquinone] 1 beta subcomplex subunit 2, mitochondrial n=1 Tax=Cynoglossus semilaevis TaxID=244447 RepID=UPI0004975F1E|nr:NADH dehydrogenase [ubiquinone] 1 beta subcomplex subunit 2, mitochondrial [Cynoglossus semilaevis]